MRNVKLVLVCLVVASLLTAMSWFYSPRLLGSVNRGFPYQFSFTPVIVNPTTRYVFRNLAFDLVFWWVIVLIMVSIVKWAIDKRNVVTYPNQEW